MPEYVSWLRQHVGHARIIGNSSAACIRDEQGRVLLQRRLDNGLWGFPGGMQELGESAMDCVRREVREEVGLDVEPRRLIGIYTSPNFDKVYPNGDQVQMNISFFEGDIIGGGLKMQEDEVIDIRWFDMNDLPPMQACCEVKAADARIFRGEAFFR